eukprot:5552732-Pyramimonas_sp.AAC.1
MSRPKNTLGIHLPMLLHVRSGTSWSRGCHSQSVARMLQAPSVANCQQEVVETRREDGDRWSCGRSRGTAGVVVPVGRLAAGRCVK